MIVALSAGRDAPSDLRARLSLDEAAQRALLGASRPSGVGELVVLSTCHRTEIYATADGLDSDAVHAVAAVLPGLLPTDQHDLSFMEGSLAIEHLFRVACGLDSLVIGEPQVLGQVRRAFVVAEQSGATGPVLSNIFSRAIRLGRSVRAETPIGRLGRSIGSIAADYLSHRFDGLDGKRATVVGAGEAATDAAKALWKAGVSLKVLSRTLASAEALAELVDAEPGTLDGLAPALEASDLAIVAVNGGIVVERDMLPNRTASNPYVILDLSVPSAVDASGRDDVDLRSLEEIPGPRGPEVTEAVIDAEAMVKRAVADLERWADTRASGPVIKDLRTFAEDVVRQEVERTISGMDLGPEQAEKVELLASRVANKLLHGPTTALRRSDETTRALVRKIFGLDG
ncbi:MAG: glutamyl-tRNA reductase [Actinomycetota bacterium]|nr:glutamyl-tRNA reductase [Actinomycetota bacterium]